MKGERRGQLNQMRPELARTAMKELRRYRKTGKAMPWPQVKRKLGLSR
jgi:hypothetical protein